MIFIDHFQFMDRAFIFDIDTRNTLTGSSDGNSITIPVAGPFSGNIYWGDGTTGSYYIDNIPVSKTYTTAGIYTIRVVPNVGFTFSLAINNLAERLKFMKIRNWGPFRIKLTAFYGCINLDMSSAIGRPTFDANLTHSFRGIGTTTILGMENWDFSGVNILFGAFRESPNFNQKLPSSMQNVTNMQGMLINCVGFTQDLSDINFNPNVILQNFMNGKSPANYSAENYSKLINRVRNAVVGTGRTTTNNNFNNGTIKYNSSGSTSRADMVAAGWTITDGGLI